MHILVFSDSHASLHFMRRCVQCVKPQALVHLGDYFDDGAVLGAENPHIPLFQVPGNCDRYRCPPNQPEILVCQVGDVYLYMTHGHKHHVKLGLGALLSDARKCHADAVLFGHTHEAYCQQEPDGMWILNPGSCGYGCSAGLIETNGGKIVNCRVITQENLAETV